VTHAWICSQKDYFRCHSLKDDLELLRVEMKENAELIEVAFDVLEQDVHCFSHVLLKRVLLRVMFK